MELGQFMQAIVTASEKAADLARHIRAEQSLFQLLVEEKTGEQKNKRFVQDFKTLADVLVQETIRHDLDRQFPGFGKNVKGEESNMFTNMLGESIVVEVKGAAQETAALLARVLGGNTAAAALLAGVVHKDVTMATDAKLADLHQQLPLEDTGLWIDPIDSTGQYIHGLDTSESCGGVYPDGLQCVTVLIGAYHRTSGQPLLGVINQPFCNMDPVTKRWTGRCVWGIACQGLRLHSDSISTTTEGTSNPGSSNPGTINQETIILSTSEDQQVVSRLEQRFSLTTAAGAGYKILCVADHLVSAYLLTKPTTFKWDTCGPHAVLLSLGGGVVNYVQVVQVAKQRGVDKVASSLSGLQLCYDKPDSDKLSGGQMYCNSGGIIAYTDSQTVVSLL